VGSVLDEVLSGGCRVDFPTVSDICEQAEADEDHMLWVVETLGRALQNDDPSCQLRALTVAHELLYDGFARQALFDEPGLLTALQSIRACGDKDPSSEVMRILSSEIVYRLNAEFLHDAWVDVELDRSD